MAVKQTGCGLQVTVGRLAKDVCVLLVQQVVDQVIILSPFCHMP